MSSTNVCENIFHPRTEHQDRRFPRKVARPAQHRKRFQLGSVFANLLIAYSLKIEEYGLYGALYYMLENLKPNEHFATFKL